MRSHLICIRLALSFLTLIAIGQYAQAQCEFKEVMRADGTLNRNYEYETVYRSDSMTIRMSLAYQGAFRTLRVEFAYTDTLKTRFYKDIDLKMTDSTVIKMYFISYSRDASSGRTSCLYEIRQKELGYLTKYDMAFFVYKRKDGTMKSLVLTESTDVIRLQLNCTRKK